MSSKPSFSGNFRGGYAPRRGRGGSLRPFTTGREQVKPDFEKHPLGQLLKTYVASYNWLNDKVPTIIVPGKPPQWTALKDAQRLKEDSGQYYRDPNAAKYPEHPTAPAVQAVLGMNPQFTTDSFDIFACGSTLGNLLRFVRGLDKAFRFNVEVIGNTVFFLRKENDPRELIKDVRGFGHTFPEANTSWEKEVKGSETHQRVVQYRFGGLTCLVRFECDGYFKEVSTGDGDSTNAPDSPAQDADDLLDAFKDTSITQSAAPTMSSTESVTVRHGGSEVTQHSIFDLKTRSGKYKKDINMSDIYPQLWIKQIPNFIVAYHDGAGLFEDIRVQDVRNGIQQWERDNADAIRRLAVLLQEIVTFAKEDDKGFLELYSPGTDRLEFRSHHGEAPHALPDRLRDEWAIERAADMHVSNSYVSDDEGYGGYDSDRGWNVDSDGDEPDYTACSVEDCGYCGKCTY